MLKKFIAQFNSIKYKYLSATFLLFFTFVTTILYVWYTNLSNEAENTSKDNIESIMQISNNAFEATLKDINNITALLTVHSSNYNNTNIISILSNKDITEAERYQYRNDAEGYLISLCSFKKYLNGLTISDLSGNTSITYGLTMPIDQLRQEPWFNTIITSKSSVVFIPPHYYDKWDEDENDKVLSIARPLFNGNEIIGFVLADVKCELLNDIFSASTQNNPTFFIFDNNINEFIVKPNSESSLVNLQKPDLEKIKKNFISNDGCFYTTFNGKDYLLIYHKSDFTGWTSVGILPKDIIMQSFTKTRNKVVIISLIFCLAAALVIFLISFLLTKNLLKLNSALKKVDKDNLDIKVSINSSDEIGQLSSQFNSMIKRIRELIQETKQKEREKRKLEMRALQAQINPHFLYNTLNTIKFLSTLQGADNIKKVSEDLSTLLHVNMDNRSFITVSEEVNYLQSYLNIQEYRYCNRFQAEISMDETVGNYLIPKLIIQPIVENALKHGIEPQKTNGIIFIKIFFDEKILKIRVKDNGPGMDAGQIEATLTSGTSSDHIGLYNVNARIKAYFDTKCSLDIFSEKGLYTLVEISIPIVSEEDLKLYV